MKSYFVRLPKTLTIPSVIVALLCGFAILPDCLVFATHSSLDPSWALAVDWATDLKLHFGKDIVFTYGPLAFLHTKIIVFHSKYWILLYDLFISILFGYIIYKVHHKLSAKNLSALFFIGAALFYKGDSVVSLNTILFLFYLFNYLHHKTKTSLAIATVMVLLQFFIKINYGAIHLFMLLVMVVYAAYKFKEQRIFLANFFLVFTLILQLSCWFLKVDFLKYLVGGIHLISGYSDAMQNFNTTQNNSTIIKIVLAIGGLQIFLSIFYCYKNKGNTINYFLHGMFSLYFFLLFKNGFVRDDTHYVDVIKVQFFIFLVLYYFDKSNLKTMWLVAFFTSFLSIFIGDYYYNTKKMEGKYIFATEYIAQIFSNTDYCKQAEKCIYANDAIDSCWIKDIDKSKTVDIIPVDISEIYYHHLLYNPRPVIQSYSAYTPYLDSINGAKYFSATAPQQVFLRLYDIDQRHPFWIDNAAKLALSTQYNIQKIDSIYDTITHSKQLFIPNYLYFKKTNSAVNLSIKNIKHLSLKWKEDVKIDTSTYQHQYLYANIQYSLWGQMMKTLYKPQLIYITIKYADNTVSRFRTFPSQLKIGILVNEKIENNLQAYHHFSKNCKANTKVKSVVFETDDINYYQPNIDANIKVIEIVQ